jgi:hypothetical protein
MRAGLSILAVVLAFMVAGCIPYRVRQTPRVTGTVVSAADQKPISHATLHYTEFPEDIVAVSKNGTFDFPVIYRWEMVPLAPFDRFGNLHLLVEAPGYHKVELSFQPGVLDMTNQTISLKR